MFESTHKETEKTQKIENWFNNLSKEHQGYVEVLRADSRNAGVADGFSTSQELNELVVN